ncbi:MAG: hypothetical protein HY521_14945 [Proteobacteria bacterium]|nr:hypothetical protein [Pseudomonadota bacterium]
MTRERPVTRRAAPAFAWMLALAPALILGACVAAPPALAPGAGPQANCGAAERVLALLAALGERVTAAARLGDGASALVTVAPEGSWSMVAINAAGAACVIAAGEGWTALARDPQKGPET